MHRRLVPALLALLLTVPTATSSLAAESPHLTSTFPEWRVVDAGDARAEVLEFVQPRSRPHAFSCRSPEVYLNAEATSIEEALALYAARLRSPLMERVVDEGPEWRLAIVDGPDLMFERLSVLLLRPDGVWLLVC